MGAGKALGRPHLQALMHDEELTVLICGGMKKGLRRRCDRALIETGDHFPDLFDAKSNKPVAQVA